MDATFNPFCKIYDNATDIFSVFDSSSPSRIPSPEPFIPSHQPIAPLILPIEQQLSMPLPPEAQYNSQEELVDALHNWAKCHHFAFSKARSRVCNQQGHRLYVWACDRYGPPPKIQQQRQHNTATRKTGCKFSVNVVSVGNSWEIQHRPNPATHYHNHLPSHLVASHPSHRQLPNELLEYLKDLHNSGMY